MLTWFREGFYGGLSVALLIGLFFLWLWQPERQIRSHSEHLLRALEKKNWTAFASFIGNDYRDQWGNDRALVLERTREVFRYLQNTRLSAANPKAWANNGHGYWQAKIIIDGANNEITARVKERVNALATPFQLEWRKVSAKPWDWKLVRVTNEELVIPSEFE